MTLVYLLLCVDAEKFKNTKIQVNLKNIKIDIIKKKMLLLRLGVETLQQIFSIFPVNVMVCINLVISIIAENISIFKV